jgi:tetratricopeptide (TPR) repeat protein
VRPPTTDLIAHDFYLQGRAAVRGGHPDDVRRAIDLFQQAVARDPSFAAAYAAMARGYTFLPIAGDLSSRETAGPAREAASRALALDEGLAAAHHAMAEVCYSTDLDVPGATRHIRRALALDPGNPDAHQFAAIVLKGQGHFRDAETHAQRALAADPLHPFMHVTLGWVYLASGRAAQGLPYLERTVQIAPHFTLAHEILIHAYLVLGRYEAALAQCRRAMEVGGRRERAMLAYVHAVRGDRADARAVLDELEAPEQLPLAPPCHMAYAYAHLGEADTAIRWLERAFDEKDPHANGLAQIPAYDPLRGDARFQALLARLRHAPPPA